jgi:hypothetical protein
VNGYIYSTVQTCFVANLNNTYFQSNEINTLTISSFYIKSKTIVCDNDVYCNNLRCNLFLSLSDSIILHQNLSLPYPFVTPKENQLGYQIIGTIINNNTNITCNTLYTVSSINIVPGYGLFLVKYLINVV